MKNINHKMVVALAVGGVLLSAISGSAYATNGYFSHGFGTKNKALAGAGSVDSEEAMVVANNPAGIATLGTRFEMGGALFTPERGYVNRASLQYPYPQNNTAVDSNKEWFLIPHMALNYRLDNKSAVAFAMYGNGGMNSTYRQKDFTGFTTFADSEDTGVDMMQLFMNFAYARTIIDERVKVGASLLYAWQRFSATGFGNFVGYKNTATVSPDEGLTNQGNDYGHGFGIKIGGQVEFAPGFTVGYSHQSRMNMTKFQRYKYLFARGGEFDIPETNSLGIAWKINSRYKFLFDLQEIKYSEIPSVGNPMNWLLDCTAGNKARCLGGEEGAGFGWTDMTIAKFGLEAKYSKNLILRFGYSKTEQPITADNVLFNVVAPAVIEEHFTAGFTWVLSKDAELDFAAMYAPNNPVIGAAGGVPFQLAPDSVEIFMDQAEIEMSYTWKF